jgi:4-aminobutyrate aminotransferase / (S)-3-amino-2-methylpropionate transaminase / 5-aminovalerate transaminase
MTDTLFGSSTTSAGRSVQTAIPGPNSLALHERRMKTVSEGVAATFPVYADHAHDAIIVDVDGNSFIDFTAASA